MRDLRAQMQDKAFVKAYFRGCETGEDVTKRLLKDEATLSSPDLIANLVKWLEEAEPSDGNEADANALAEQALQAARLPSQEKEEEKEEETSEDSGGKTSSDGTSRESSSSKSTGFGSSKS